jgi:hypothetical protein
LLVTVPRPVVETDNTGNELNVAVAEVFSDTVIVQGPLPLHAPPQPANIEFPVGVADNTTWVPTLKLAPHVGLQLIPDGVLLTVPPPFPAG